MNVQGPIEEIFILNNFFIAEWFLEGKVKHSFNMSVETYNSDFFGVKMDAKTYSFNDKLYKINIWIDGILFLSIELVY